MYKIYFLLPIPKIVFLMSSFSCLPYMEEFVTKRHFPAMSFDGQK